MKITKLAIVLLVLSGLTDFALAGATYTFKPAPIDLKTKEYFTWGINFNLTQGEVITGATLTYYNIDDGKKGKNDYLYTHLLDNPSAGLKGKKDNSVGRDDFAGNGLLVGTWTSNPGGKSGKSNLVYDFGVLGLMDDLNKYANTSGKKGNSNFGFGIDPDGNYNYSNIKFVITTGSMLNSIAVPIPVAVVPVPGAIILGSIGTCFVGWLRRRRTL